MYPGQLKPGVRFFEKDSPVIRCSLFTILEGKHVHVVITVVLLVSLSFRRFAWVSQTELLVPPSKEPRRVQG